MTGPMNGHRPASTEHGVPAPVTAAPQAAGEAQPSPEAAYYAGKAEYWRRQAENWHVAAAAWQERALAANRVAEMRGEYLAIAMGVCMIAVVSMAAAWLL